MYGSSSRTLTNATPNSSGVCSASGAGPQTGWNIKWVDIAAGAAGGSDLGDWALSEPLVSDPKTTTARALYDHSSTRAIWFYMYGGASFCNPSDWFCNDLTLGTAANEGGRAKWGDHSVKFRDDNEAYNHDTNSNWGGVVSLVRSDMVNNAR